MLKSGCPGCLAAESGRSIQATRLPCFPVSNVTITLSLYYFVTRISPETGSSCVFIAGVCLPRKLFPPLPRTALFPAIPIGKSTHTVYFPSRQIFTHIVHTETCFFFFLYVRNKKGADKSRIYAIFVRYAPLNALIGIYVTRVCHTLKETCKVLYIIFTISYLQERKSLA